MWNYRKTRFKALERQHNPNYAVNTIYNHEIDIESIQAWRLCPNSTINENNTTGTMHQKQYLTHYAPMIIERWALSAFKKAGFDPKEVQSAARVDINDACCQICNSLWGFEPTGIEGNIINMYVCNNCERTYHWKCLLDTGCHTEEHRARIDRSEEWECPACASLSQENKDKIKEAANLDELIKVEWNPSWEPEEMRDTWPL